MALLEFLVPSRGRRALLELVSSGQGGGTIRQLSRRARVAYSSAHREIEVMRRLGLVRTKRVGRAIHCTWNSSHPGARAIAALIGKDRTGGGGPDDAQVYWNLGRWGAPLLRVGRSGRALSLEETLAHALGAARRYPELARVWPIVLARNRGSVDLASLERRARLLGEKRTLGFFLSLTRMLLKDPTLAPWERRLRDRRVRRDQPFFILERGRRARDLAEERTPEVARAWCFRLNMPFDSFESAFRKFIPPR